MVVRASVGELVKLPFLVTDVDGLTPVTGLLDGSFAKTLILDDTASAVPVTVAEAAGASGRYGFPFRYGAVRQLHSAYGMRLRVFLLNDLPFSGERATATFYMISSAE